MRLHRTASAETRVALFGIVWTETRGSRGRDTARTHDAAPSSLDSASVRSTVLSLSRPQTRPVRLLKFI